MAPHTLWTFAEEKALVDFLHKNKSEAGDGGNFKKPTFQRAAQHIAPLRTNGHAKDFKCCQNKWAALRKLFKAILAIKSVSGWHWDDETGASITPETASSWDDYVKKHPKAKPFRNKGWPHLHNVSDIMPSTPAGTNVFHPTAAPLPPPVATSSSVSSPSLESDTSDVEEIESSTSRPQKRAREPATPTHAKRVRKSAGAEALLGMSVSLNDFGSKVIAALAPPSTGMEPTPRRRTNSIIFAQRTEKCWLTTCELVSFIDILHRDPTAFDVYLAITEPDVRMDWVRVQLDNIGVLEH